MRHPAFFDLCNLLILKNCITSVELLTLGRNSIQNRGVTVRILLDEPTGSSVYIYNIEWHNFSKLLRIDVKLLEKNR